MDTLHELSELFRTFPGIGPRQAKRFVHHLLTRRADAARLAELTAHIGKHVIRCEECRRFVSKEGALKICRICRNENRDRSTLIVVAHDVDLEAVEKSGSFRGIYFVLGGTVPILDKQPETRVALRELITFVEERARAGLKEIVLALSANTEGENTAEIVGSALAPLVRKYTLKLSRLGRGLSTGTELEYADAETLTNALVRRI